MKRLSRLCAMIVAMCWIATAPAAPPLETYGKLPGFEMAAISPSGKKVALMGVVGDERRLIVIEDGKTLINSDVGDHKVRSLDWAGEDLVMLRISETVPLGVGFSAARTEVSRMFIVQIGDKPIWSIFGKSQTIGGSIHGFYGVYERNGVSYGYFGGLTLTRGNGGAYVTSFDPDLYEVDLRTQKTRLIAHRPDRQEDWRDWIVSPDGTVAATLEYSSARGEWRIRNARRETIASGQSPTGRPDLLSLGRSADTIIYRLGDEESGARLWEQPLKGGPATEILRDQGFIGYHRGGSTGQMIGYVRDGDIPEDMMFDAAAAKIMAATRRAFPGLSVKLIDQNEAFDRLIVRTSGPGDPGNWWLVDTKKRSADNLGVSYPIRAEDVGPMRMIRYKAADGVDMAGVLTLPPGRQPKNLAVVVMPHGGPQARDYPEFDWMAQAFASRGYAVFQPNFRGSSGSGSAFVRAGWGEWGGKMQTDISDGLAELARQGIADPKRACIVGTSYGGYAALAGVTLQQGLYRCAVSVAGIGDVRKLISTDIAESGNNPALVRVLRKELGKGRDLALVSPIRFVDRADAPVMLIHGVDDIIVPYRQSAEMAAALQRAGKPVELVKLAGEDHWLSRSGTRLTMLKAAVGFVEKHNPPDPAK
ncbi:alpha/beta hydrolase family protein [Sphingomonas sp. SRS2]|uniref:alpha/beta hydrolase family protein n=1 Tax=Sphingomonas sp. SRS2 TaxID=133190 RepID=UPI000618478F|nr:S9 family peptidase [Sphingomonas sp. SRS2]KKC26280.1 hypothetical protein WP12_09420 [Sphingomonas sp. SRS2]